MKSSFDRDLSFNMHDVTMLRLHPNCYPSADGKSRIEQAAAATSTDASRLLGPQGRRGRSGTASIREVITGGAVASPQG